MSEPYANPETDSDPSVQRAADDLRDAASQEARSASDTAEERAQQIKESAAQRAQQFRDYAEPVPQGVPTSEEDRASQFQWEETRVKAREFHADLEEYIRMHPTQSVLFAAGAGFLLGLIVRR